MSFESEIKDILRTGSHIDKKAEDISKISIFSKEDVIKGLSIKEYEVADMYKNIVREHRKNV